MADPHGLKFHAARAAARRPLWKRAIPYAVTAAVVAGIAVAATVTVMNSRAPAPTVVTRFPIVLPADHRFLNIGRNVIAISPDGANIVYVANRQLYLRRIGDMEPRAIQGTSQNASRPFFSPDGRWIGYVSRDDNKLKKIAIAGGAAVTISDIDNSSGFGPVWNADNFIYFGVPRAIVRVPANGGSVERIIELKNDQIGHRPQLLPDGDSVLFTMETGGPGGPTQWDSAQVVVQSMKSGRRKVLIPGGSDGRYVPTGHIVYALGATVLAVPFDLKTLQTGGPVPVIEGVRRSTGAGFGGADAQFAFADNGSLVYIPGNELQPIGGVSLVLVDRSGIRKPLNVPAGPYLVPRISPDGSRLAVTHDAGAGRDVWTGDLNDRSPMRKVTLEGRSYNPVWTRDGERIAYTSDRSGDPAIFWQRITGGPAERIVTGEPGNTPQAEAWSPDGRQLFFAFRLTGAAAAGGISMLTVGADQKPTLVIKPPAQNCTVSPDGRWIAYNAPESPGGRQNEVYVEPIPATGERHQVTTAGGVSPLWSPGGNELFYLTSGPTGQIVSVEVQTQHGFVFGKATALPIQGIVNSVDRSYDVTPDGKHFLVLVPNIPTAPGNAPAEQINVTLNWFEELKQRVPVK